MEFALRLKGGDDVHFAEYFRIFSQSRVRFFLNWYVIDTLFAQGPSDPKTASR